jgi:hypothetical protein
MPELGDPLGANLFHSLCSTIGFVEVFFFFSRKYDSAAENPANERDLVQNFIKGTVA